MQVHERDASMSVRQTSDYQRTDAGPPKSGVHSVVLKSSIEYPSGQSPSKPSKPVTLFSPGQLTLADQLATSRSHRAEGERSSEEPAARRPARTDSARGSQPAQHNISVSARPRQWLPTIPGELAQGTTTNSLLLSPRASANVMVAARMLDEHGPQALRTPEGAAHGNGLDYGTEGLLREANEDKARLRALLKKREEEIESLHQLLWHSDVAPSAGELIRMRQSVCVHAHEQDVARLTALAEAYRTQLLHHGITPDEAPEQVATQPVPEQVPEGERASEREDERASERESEAARILALEQQLVKYAKVIREQHFASKRPYETVHPLEMEELRVHLQQKQDALAEMNGVLARKDAEVDSLLASLRNRDNILSQRQAEITAKEEQIVDMQQTIARQERTVGWLRDKVVCVCVCVCVCVWCYTRARANAHTHTCTHARTRTHTHIHTHTHTHTQTHTHKHTHTHTHTYTPQDTPHGRPPRRLHQAHCTLGGGRWRKRSRECVRRFPPVALPLAPGSRALLTPPSASGMR